MAILALIISIVALIVAILAYQRTGGTADLARSVDVLRDRLADALDRLERSLRREREGGEGQQQ